MKIEQLIKNQTSNGTQTIHLLLSTITVNQLFACIDENAVREACHTGCINYSNKWCCPPYSKKITNIISQENYKYAMLICGYINLTDMDYIKNPYQKIKAANMILKSCCEKLAREYEVKVNGYCLLSGSCNLCKPCYKKRGLPCNKPSVMRYSLESTGINVEQLAKKVFNHTLLWYKKGSMPEYTSVVTAILCKNIDEISLCL